MYRGRAEFLGGGDSYAAFAPTGRPLARGAGGRRMLANRTNWSSSCPTEGARLFVGFNVGKKPRWNMRDLMGMVRLIREEQTGDPASTFIAQKGIYTHTGSVGAEAGTVIEEDGGQVIILNLDPDLSSQAFDRQMRDLATLLARAMEQEEVIVEIQRGGITQKTYGIGP